MWGIAGRIAGREGDVEAKGGQIGKSLSGELWVECDRQRSGGGDKEIEGGGVGICGIAHKFGIYGLQRFELFSSFIDGGIEVGDGGGRARG